MWSKLIEFSKAPVFPEDEEKTRRARILNALYINLFVVLGILGGSGVVFVFKEKLITSAR